MLNWMKSMSSFSIPITRRKLIALLLVFSVMQKNRVSQIEPFKLLPSERPLSLGIYSSDDFRNYPWTNFRLELPRPVARLETEAESVEHTPSLPLFQVQQIREGVHMVSDVTGMQKWESTDLLGNHFLSSGTFNFAYTLGLKKWRQQKVADDESWLSLFL